MSGYSFRIRFNRSPTDALNIDSAKWERPLPEKGLTLILSSHHTEHTIKKSHTLVFKSDGWSTEEEAECAANKYINALMLTLAKLRIGADFGKRGSKSIFTNAGLDLLSGNSEVRVLNDTHGLMLYESNPQPLFASMHTSVERDVPKEHFEKAFSYAINSSIDLTKKEKISFELFNASFFQKTTDTRFLLLVMAIEALLNPSERNSAAKEHVSKLIAETENNPLLSQDEKKSLIGSLKWLYNQSINQAGRELARRIIGEKKYADKSPEAFFSHCYSIRSRLVHGASPLPTQETIGKIVGQLEIFVSDILSGDLKDIELT